MDDSVEVEMSIPCDKGTVIDAVSKEQHQIRNEQHTQNIKLDQVLHNQHQLGIDIKQAIDGLTKIIMADIETRKDVEQLKKDREILFDLVRADALQIARINERNAKCDGAGIFENFPKMWDWYKQHDSAYISLVDQVETESGRLDKVYDWYMNEMGWRRFIPSTLTIISGILVIYVTLVGLASTPTLPKDVEPHQHLPYRSE